MMLRQSSATYLQAKTAGVKSNLHGGECQERPMESMSLGDVRPQ